MNQIFTTAVTQLWKAIGEGKEIAFATSERDQVTVRMVSAILHDEKIYFITFDHSMKIEQVKGNENVAFCVEGIQVTGTAKIMGHPRSPEYKVLAEAMTKTYPNDFPHFSDAPNVVFVEITPKTAQFFDQTVSPPAAYQIDFMAHTATTAEDH